MIAAPDGPFGQAAMKISTAAALDPGTRDSLMSSLAALVSQRAPVAIALHDLIVAGDQGAPIPAAQAGQLNAQASQLLAQIEQLAK